MAELIHRYSPYNKEYLAVAADERIKHNDFFELKSLYMLLHEWLVEEGWAPRNDANFPERLYLHRFTQQLGQELWVWWRLSKELNNYYKWDLDIDWHIIGLKETEVMHDGVKYKANFGEVEFKVYAKMISDHKGEWRKHWLLKHFQNLYWKGIYWQDFQMHKIELLREVQRMFDAIKVYCKLKTYLPEPEGQRFYLKKDRSLEG